MAVGDTVVVDVDLQFATMWLEPNRIHDPDKLAIVMDHAVPAPTLKDAAGGPRARKFAADFGIRNFYDVGRHGICHQVIAENRFGSGGHFFFMEYPAETATAIQRADGVAFNLRP